MNKHLMHTNVFSVATALSDQQLAAQVRLLAGREREITAVLITHLAIFDERELYRAQGCSSMFTYCVEVLHLSEHAALCRIEAARAARRFPLILEMLSDGSVNLTTVRLLAPHLTAENHVGVLTAAKHLRKQQVQELVASLRPQPPVPSTMRKLPTPTHGPTPVQPEGVTQESESCEQPATLTLEAPARTATVAPLAPERYRVQFTATAETHAKLRQAQELLRHQIPDGDVGEVIDRALTVLLKQLTKQKFAATDRPREKSYEAEPESRRVSRSRHVPAAVRRAVWKRDGAQCAFVGQDGRRCTERGCLEFHHVVPYSAGGAATVENIQLRCRVHNNYEFELVCFSERASAVREDEVPYFRVNSVQNEYSVQNELGRWRRRPEAIWPQRHPGGLNPGAV